MDKTESAIARLKAARARRKHVYKLWKSGMKMTQIAKDMGLSRQRVAQLLKTERQ